MNTRNRILGLSEAKLVEQTKFWEGIRNKLDGYTIYIPFVDPSILEIGHQHGLFDAVGAAIDGEIRKSVLFKANDHIVYGSRLDRKTISRRIRAKGYVLVGNSDADVKDPQTWRCMSMDNIDIYRKDFSAADLRRKVFDILASKSNYVVETGYIWPNTSETKEKVMNFCKLAFSTDDFTKCRLLISRNQVAKKISTATGVVIK